MPIPKQSAFGEFKVWASHPPIVMYWLDKLLKLAMLLTNTGPPRRLHATHVSVSFWAIRHFQGF